MAEAKKAEGGEVAEPPKKKGKLLLFIIIGVLVLVLGGGATAFLLMKKKADPDEEGGDEETTSSTQKSSKKGKKDGHDAAPPVFVKLDPFTVKLQAEGGESYLQTTPELKVTDPHLSDKIKPYTPEIRHRVLLILSAKKAADLANPQGVQSLADEIRVAINVIVDGPKDHGKKKKGKSANTEETSGEVDPDDSVQAVVFTSFIIQ